MNLCHSPNIHRSPTHIEQGISADEGIKDWPREANNIRNRLDAVIAATERVREVESEIEEYYDIDVEDLMASERDELNSLNRTSRRLK
jgi:hypothetical protein